MSKYWFKSKKYGYGAYLITWQGWLATTEGEIRWRWGKDEFKQGFAFLELLLVLTIILFLGYQLLNLYFKKTPFDTETKKALSDQGIDTTNYKTMTDTVRGKIQDITKQHLKELDNIK